MIRQLSKRLAIAGGLSCLCAISTAQAQLVGGSYQGSIVTDSGLGLIGDILRIDFTYDDATAGTPSGNQTWYTSFLQSLTVTINGHQWQFGPDGFSDLFLSNDDVQVFALGTEDRMTLFSGGYSGPALVAGADNYTFDLYLSDTEPSGAPDGLTDDTALPAVAPNPDLFTGDGQRVMVFSFTVGDLETGDRYAITTDNVSSVALIPLPASASLFVSAIVAGALRVRRRVRV